MLNYTITGDSIGISEKVRSYIEKRFKGFERFLDDGASRDLFVIVSKTTAKEREDSVCVEVRFKLHERDFFVAGEAADITAAIDAAKEELMREVTQSNAKRRTLFHRGARKIKKLLKGRF